MSGSIGPECRNADPRNEGPDEFRENLEIRGSSATHRERRIEQHEPVDTRCVFNGGDHGDEATHRVADERCSFEIEGVDYLRDETTVVLDAWASISWGGFTEADEVESGHAPAPGEERAGDVPVLG